MHRTVDTLHINLRGDFDGSAAFELLNTLKENLNNSKHIFIDTNSLKQIYPFGREVFNNNFQKLKNHQIRIQYIGPNALQIAPT
jgi:anti-anti-sigma regulatory factor